MSQTTGVLLVNLGTPAAATVKAVRRYLKEFLSDPRIIALPKLLWWPVLNGIILPLRPARSRNAYQKIWLPEGSPLAVYSTRLAGQLQSVLPQKTTTPCEVLLAMRYGQPSIAKALQTFKQHNVEKIFVLPLYPQYSLTTTASVFDAITAFYKKAVTIPALQFIPHYYQSEAYRNAFAEHIRQHWQARGIQSEYLLFSFHGLPASLIAQGDPYYQQCQNTAETIAKRLKLTSSQWSFAFQSRFGKQPWCQPYCDQVLASLAAQGIKSISVICPGFAVDCLETLEEIAIQYKALYLKSGGEHFDYIPALNDLPCHAHLLSDVLLEQAQNWLIPAHSNA